MHYYHYAYFQIRKKLNNIFNDFEYNEFTKEEVCFTHMKHPF